MRSMLMVLAVFCCSPVLANDPATGFPRQPVAGEKAWVNPAPEGEFTRASFGIVCSGRKTAAMPTADEIARASEAARKCLRIGAVYVGDSRAAIENRFGKAIRTIPQPNGTVAEIYPEKWLPAAGGHSRLAVYWVIFYRGDQAVTVQLTGDAYAGAAFSSIRLGDPEQKVIDRFGRPSSTHDVPAVRATLWRYWNYPFSFEVREGLVFSMQVRESQAFTPPDSR